jgi:hypothetical protein
MSFGGSSYKNPGKNRSTIQLQIVINSFVSQW